MQQFKLIITMVLIGSVPLYADDVVLPGADLGKASALPPPPSSVAPRPDPAANAQPQNVPNNQNPDAITRPVPGYQGGPYVRGGEQYWLPNNIAPQVGTPYYYSANQGPGSTYGMTGPSVGMQAGQTWFGGYHSANTGMQNRALSSSSDPYTRHFGPGFYRSQEYGHFRFPSYSYRRPWYNPGAPTYNRDTNYRW